MLWVARCRRKWGTGTRERKTIELQNWDQEWKHMGGGGRVGRIVGIKNNDDASYLDFVVSELYAKVWQAWDCCDLEIRDRWIRIKHPRGRKKVDNFFFFFESRSRLIGTSIEVAVSLWPELKSESKSSCPESNIEIGYTTGRTDPGYHHKNHARSRYTNSHHF